MEYLQINQGNRKGGIGVLKLKTRKNEIKKVLIYGLDGTGKSTFATDYCKEHNLNPVVIDVDDTNYTDVDILDIDLSNDIKAYQSIKSSIKDVKESEYDTIILDGVTSLLELLTSKAKGMKAYKDRADRWGGILHALQNSGKNLIFVGQADMEVIFNDEYQSPKPIIKVNSIVNEKYLTIYEKGQYQNKLIKYRGRKDKSTPKSQIKNRESNPPEQAKKTPSRNRKTNNDNELNIKELEKKPHLDTAIETLRLGEKKLNLKNILTELQNMLGEDTITQDEFNQCKKELGLKT